MERTEARFAVAFPLRVTDDRAFNGLSCFDFQPGIAALSGHVGAAALLGHDALKTHLLNGFEESRSLFHYFTYAIRGILFDRVRQPLAPACQRLVDNWSSIQI